MQIISGNGVKNVLTFVETGCIDSQFDCLVKTPILKCEIICFIVCGDHPPLQFWLNSWDDCMLTILLVFL